MLERTYSHLVSLRLQPSMRPNLGLFAKAMARKPLSPVSHPVHHGLTSSLAPLCPRADIPPRHQSLKVPSKVL